MKEWNIRKVISIFWKGKLLIIMCTVVAAILGYIYNSKFTKPMYKSTSTIILSVFKDDTSGMSENEEEKFDSSDLSLNERLMNTYSQIITSDSVMDKVVENLNLKMTGKQLAKSLTVTTEAKSTIIRIDATANDPELAAKIINETEQLFFQRIDELYKIKSSKVLDAPNVEKNPTNIDPKKYAFIFGTVGFVLAISILLVKEFLNENIKTELDIEKNTKMNVLSTVEHLSGRQKLASLDSTQSATESFRLLVSNIKALGSRVVLITSNTPAEGKSIVSANLAITYANSGKKILLIDSDMRRGTQHQLFEIADNRGLSNLIFDDDNQYSKYIHKDVIPGLDILPKGNANLNYSKLLFSEITEKIVKDARENYDFIIVDGTPCQMVADGALLYKAIDSVIVVVKYDNTRVSEVNKIYKAITRNNGKVLGAVINDVPKTYGRYKNYNYYSDAQMPVVRKSKSKHS